MQNAYYDMTLRVDGDRLSGVFANTANRIYSGALTGIIRPGQKPIFYRWHGVRLSR